jgi:hypothetical protein
MGSSPLLKGVRGLFNMDYQSMFDNYEQATFSRSKQYPEHFLAEWNRLSEELKEGFNGRVKPN